MNNVQQNHMLYLILYFYYIPRYIYFEIIYGEVNLFSQLGHICGQVITETKTVHTWTILQVSIKGTFKFSLNS